MAELLEFTPFESISDFKWSMKCGGEVEFIWNGKSYAIVHTDEGICITEAYKPETELISQNVDDILDYMIGDNKLREIITEIDIDVRTI